MASFDKIKYSEIEEKINTIKELSSKVENNLTKVNKLVASDVGSGAKIWEGKSANEFLNRWNEVSTQIPTLIENMDIQITNLQEVLKNFAPVDDATVI